MLYTDVCIPYRNMCVYAHAHAHTLYVWHMHTQEACMTTSDDSHTLYWMRLSIPKPQETLLNENFVFNLCDFFKEHKPGVKRDLPVFRDAGK